MNRRLFLSNVAAGAVSLLLPACGPSAKERETMTKLIESMQTQFVGRMLIDLPKGFDPHPGNNATLIYGLDKDWRSITIEVLSTTADQRAFKNAVRVRAEKLAAEEHDALHVPMLIKQTKISEQSVLLRSYEDGLLKDSFNCELYVLVHDHLVVAKDSVYQMPLEPIEARLAKLASHMSVPTDPKQAGPGFFLGRLLINDGQDSENGEFNFYSKEFPDIHWEVSSRAIVENDEGLLRRWASKKGLLDLVASPPTDIVRKGKTRIAQMDGEELLQKIKILDQPSLYFTAESMRSDPGLAKPLLTIELNTGSMEARNEEHAKPSSWSVDEAVAVWDAVVKSIRPRPGAF